MSGTGLSFLVTRSSEDVGFSCLQAKSEVEPRLVRCMPIRAINPSRRFMDQVRQRTKRRVPLKTEQLIAELNPLLRGWGEYYKRAHVRKLFNRLDRWVVRRHLVASI